MKTEAEKLAIMKIKADKHIAYVNTFKDIMASALSNNIIAGAVVALGLSAMSVTLKDLMPADTYNQFAWGQKTEPTDQEKVTSGVLGGIFPIYGLINSVGKLTK